MLSRRLKMSNTLINTINVIVVDDEPIHSAAFRTAFEGLTLKSVGPFATTITTGMREADGVLDRHQGTYHLLVTRWHLKDGLGPELILRFRQANPGAKCIVVATDPDSWPDMHKRGLDRPDDVLPYPFQMTELLAMLMKLGLLSMQRKELNAAVH